MLDGYQSPSQGSSGEDYRWSRLELKAGFPTRDKSLHDCVIAAVIYLLTFYWSVRHEIILTRGLLDKWRSCLRHCATRCKVAGSIPVRVTGIFLWLIPSGRIQPPTEVSNRNVFWRFKAARCVGLTTMPPSGDDCLEIPGASTSRSPKGLPGLQWNSLTLTVRQTQAISKQIKI
jgi:hypothetical protein